MPPKRNVLDFEAMYEGEHAVRKTFKSSRQLPDEVSPGYYDQRNVRDDKPLDDTPLRRKKTRTSTRRSNMERNIRAVHDAALSPAARDALQARNAQSPKLLFVPDGVFPVGPHRDLPSDATPGSAPSKALPKKIEVKKLPAYDPARFYPLRNSSDTPPEKPNNATHVIKALRPPKKIVSKITNPYVSNQPLPKARRSKEKSACEPSTQEKKETNHRRKTDIARHDFSPQFLKPERNATSECVPPTSKGSRSSRKSNSDGVNPHRLSHVDSPSRKISQKEEKEENRDGASPSTGVKKTSSRTSVEYWNMPLEPREHPVVTEASAMQVIENTLKEPKKWKDHDEILTAGEKAEKRRKLKRALVDEIIGKLEKKYAKEELKGGREKKLKKLKKKLKKERAEKERLKAESDAAQLEVVRSAADAAAALAEENSIKWKQRIHSKNVILIAGCILFWLSLLGVLVVFFAITNADGCTLPQAQCCSIVSDCNVFCVREDTMARGCFGFFPSDESARVACTGICSASHR